MFSTLFDIRGCMGRLRYALWMLALGGGMAGSIVMTLIVGAAANLLGLRYALTLGLMLACILASLLGIAVAGMVLQAKRLRDIGCPPAILLAFWFVMTVVSLTPQGAQMLRPWSQAIMFTVIGALAVWPPCRRGGAPAAELKALDRMFS